MSILPRIVCSRIAWGLHRQAITTDKQSSGATSSSAILPDMRQLPPHSERRQQHLTLGVR